MNIIIPTLLVKKRQDQHLNILQKDSLGLNSDMFDPLGTQPEQKENVIKNSKSEQMD